MKIYQCIHKYGPHIKPFEKRWGIGDHSSFSEIHRALMLDGYACVYRLVPPPERPDDSVFFTVWNYERLQRAWARENDIGATTLDEIRLAQIELMKPDVVYDFSSFVSPSFASKLRAVFAGLIIAWNGVIKGEDPPADTAYDGYASLHRPFVKSWKKRGLPALELQPGVEPEWGDLEVRPFAQRKEELIIYGQLGNLFGKRAALVSEVLKASSHEGYRFKCFAQVSKLYYRPGGRLARFGIDLPFLVKWPDKYLGKALSEPIYGIELYETIRESKAVLNNFTDLSISFHSNMRIFETIANGTVLLTPKGAYPEGLEENIDYYPYSSVQDISRIVKAICADPEAAFEFASRAKKRMLHNFSKRRQYCEFAHFLAAL